MSMKRAILVCAAVLSPFAIYIGLYVVVIDNVKRKNYEGKTYLIIHAQGVPASAFYPCMFVESKLKGDKLLLMDSASFSVIENAKGIPRW